MLFASNANPFSLLDWPGVAQPRTKCCWELIVVNLLQESEEYDVANVISSSRTDSCKLPPFFYAIKPTPHTSESKATR
jgi:hypothetical protein